MNSIAPLLISAQFSISPARLFKLLSMPEYLEQWLSPDESITVKVIEHDFRVNGSYKLDYTLPDGNHNEVHGTFIDISEPDLISFTWVWQKPDHHADIESIVTWRLLAKEKQTELTVIHEGPSKDFYDRHLSGWNGTLNHLSKIIAKED